MLTVQIGPTQRRVHRQATLDVRLLRLRQRRRLRALGTWFPAKLLSNSLMTAVSPPRQRAPMLPIPSHSKARIFPNRFTR